MVIHSTTSGVHSDSQRFSFTGLAPATMRLSEKKYFADGFLITSGNIIAFHVFSRVLLVPTKYSTTLDEISQHFHMYPVFQHW